MEIAILHRHTHTHTHTDTQTHTTVHPLLGATEGDAKIENLASVPLYR